MDAKDGLPNRDSYLTLAREGTNKRTIERSRFLGSAGKVTTEDQAREFLRQVRQIHSDATHNCCAWVLGTGGEHQFADDNGEPSGSAGRPILGAIASLGLTNVCVVVTRYYGGKKLGIRGLIDAYGTTARELLEELGNREEVLHDRLEVVCAYPEADRILYLLQQMDARILERQYTAIVRIEAAVRRRDVPEAVERLESFGEVRVL